MHSFHKDYGEEHGVARPIILSALGIVLNTIVRMARRKVVFWA